VRRDGEVRALGEAVSGTRILDTATELSRLHRTPGSPGYAAAVDVVTQRLSESGLSAIVHEYPADGETKTYAWTAPPAWSVRSGVLVETGPAERLIADFTDVAQAVVVHSPGGTFEGELVALGAPVGEASYEEYDLVGKVALVCARASEAVPRAARRGAVGVVLYPDDERAAVSHDLVQYQSIFPRREDIAGLVPAFSVSRRAADRLIRALTKGPIVLRGEIDAEFAHGKLQVIEAATPGTVSGAGTVLLTAHLCHPRGSANDNASGAAALVEIARAVRESPLRPSVRLLWMPEFYGSLPWAAEHADVLRGVEYALNLDMVGASPERIGEPLRIFRAANHTPHYLNALVEPLAREVAGEPACLSTRGSVRPWHWSFALPSGGSDHVVFAASPHRRPALMLGHDDPYWHTDFDTPDKLDPTRLKQVSVLAAAIAGRACPDAARAAWLWDQLLAYSVRELTRARELAGPLDPRTGARLLDLALGIEVERAHTLDSMGPAAQSERAGFLRAARLHLEPPGPRAQRLPEEDERRPVRRVDGPLVYSITDEFTEEERTFFKERLGANHRALAEGLLNHCDGTKTPLDIALTLTLDAGGLVSVEDVRRGIDLYRKAGCVA
jgi:hypothetical protein